MTAVGSAPVAEAAIPAPSGPPPRAGRAARGPAAWLARRAIRLYQVARAGRPSPCRFVPSCSTYALEAVDRFGALRGTFLAAKRLARCHPWGGHGYDPVPARKEG